MATSITGTAETIGNKLIAAIPVVGAFLAPIAGAIENIFGSAHNAALAKEASTLNTAMPAFLNQVQAVMTAASIGQLNEAQAIQALQQAESVYESTVASIIKDNGTCFSGCALQSNGSTYTWGSPEAIADFNGSSSPGGQLALKKGLATVNETTHCCNSGNVCNAACCLRCGIILPTVQACILMIEAGEGSFTVPPSATNGAIQGTPAFTITYKAPTTLTFIESYLQGNIALGTAWAAVEAKL